MTKKAKRRLRNRRRFFMLIIIILAIFISSATLFNHTQTVKVDNVEFELPADYVKEPARTDVNYDGNVKSSAMGWSNDKNYIVNYDKKGC